MNKTLFITGAATGIGAATARLAVRRGCNVVIADINALGAQVLAAELGANALAIALDVCSAGQWQQALDCAWQHFGRVDVLVNNAGIIHPGYARSVDLEQHRRTVEVNYLGPVAGMLAALPRFKSQGGGHLVTICSMTAFIPVVGMASYAGTKHALRAFHHGLAIEERGGPVQFSIIHPPAVQTPMLEQEQQCAEAALAFADKAVAPEVIAATVLDAIERGLREVVFPPLLGRVMRLFGAIPGIAYRAIARAEQQGRRKLLALRAADRSAHGVAP